MASTSPLCRAERLYRRSDLVLRPLPEIGLCMVYRPRPARIVTLNPASWMLLAYCDGDSVEKIEARYAALLAGKGRTADPKQLRQGLQELVDLSLVRVCPDPPAHP